MRTRQWLLGSWMVLVGACPGRPADCGRAEGCGPAALVRPGLEVLLDDSLHLVRGRRVALVTNQSGVDRAGRSGVERLRAAGVSLVALFSPEHGFRGTAAPGEVVASTTDSATGLPIYSLYGRNSAPTDSQLAGVEVILVDLQDAGARYYTYLWTAVEVMRSAGRRGIPVVLLDRPNPIGGAVQGNVLDTAYRSPVGLIAIPMRHGMTLGELARLARSDLGLAADLTVVPVAGWRRDMYFDETGLPFVPPSPNLRTLDALIHYPGTCLFEGTSLSVGRGSDRPFEQVGGVDLDTAGILAELRRDPPPGVRFVATQFTPRAPGDGKYADTALVGIRLEVTDRSRYDPTLAAVRLLTLAVRHGAAPDCPGCSAAERERARLRSLRYLEAHLRRLLGGPDLPLIESGRLGAIAGTWAGQRADFRVRRRPFLLYPE